jgi:hypothetical protein
MVEILDVANREDTDVVGGIVNDVVAELCRHGESIENERLHMLEDIATCEVRKDAPQWTGVEAKS